MFLERDFTKTDLINDLVDRSAIADQSRSCSHRCSVACATCVFVLVHAWYIYGGLETLYIQSEKKKKLDLLEKQLLVTLSAQVMFSLGIAAVHDLTLFKVNNGSPL
jgi:hypothetical protein